MMEDDLRREMDEIRRKKAAAEKKKEAEVKPQAEADDLDDEMEKIRKVRIAPAKKPEAEPKAEVKEKTKTDEPQVYVVQPGDSLSKISQEVYGKAGRWKEIYEANKDQIENPNLIRPGQELRIP